MMANEQEVGRLVTRMTGDNSDYRKMVGDTENRTRGMAQKMTSTFTKAGLAMSAAITLPLAAIGKKSVSLFGDFNQNITEAVAKLGDATPEEIGKIEKSVRDLAKSGDVKFGAAELAKGIEELAGAGLDAERSMAALPVVSKLAQAGMFDVGTATSSLIGSMASFRQMSDVPEEFSQTMVRFSDVMVGVANLTQTSVKGASQAMAGDAANAARQYGMSLEELGAAAAVMASQNIEAEEASNLLGRAIRLTTSSFVSHQDVWKRMGIDITDGKGNFIKFSEAIGKVDTALKHLSPEDKVKALSEMGIETLSQKAIFPFLGMTDKLDGFEAKLKETGTTAKMAATQMTSFQNQVEVAKNKVFDVGIEIGQRLLPTLNKMMDGVSSAVKWWDNLDNETKELIIDIGKFAAVAGPGILLVAGAVKVLGVAMIALPWVAAAAGITAVVVGLSELTSWATDGEVSLRKLGETLGLVAKKEEEIPENLGKKIDPGWMKELMDKGFVEKGILGEGNRGFDDPGRGGDFDIKVEEPKDLKKISFAEMMKTEERKKAAELARAQRKEQKEMAKRAIEIWEETRTPAEQQQMQIMELNKLYQQGALDVDTYGRAMDAVTKSTEQAAVATDRLAASVTNTSSGSLEALSRISAYRELMSGGMERVAGMLPTPKEGAKASGQIGGKVDLGGEAIEYLRQIANKEEVEIGTAEVAP
jgi:TP901 family phage tail tape measure protein